MTSGIPTMLMKDGVRVSARIAREVKYGEETTRCMMMAETRKS